MVGFKTGYNWFEVGKGEILVSFFSTVIARLEYGMPGSMYPTAVNEFYAGFVPVDHLEQLSTEMFEITMCLSVIPVKQFVWDIEKPRSKPSRTFVYNKKAKNLGEFYTTHDGKPLLQVMAQAINKAIENQQPLEIQFVDDRFTTVLKF